MQVNGAYVYIRASKRNGTLYTGFAHDLAQRFHQHQTGQGSKFAHKYGVNKLVYYEHHDYIQGAILRETQIKKWERKWKLRLIEEINPEWDDLTAMLNN